MKKNLILDPRSLFPILLILFISCTFNYGETDSSSENMPNLIMKNVEYVRVQSGDPLARVVAEYAERYEKKSLMTLENLYFEQFGEKGDEVNVYGRAGYAQIETDSGDLFLDGGVMIDVRTEEIALETFHLEWKDQSRILSGGDHDEVYIYRRDGSGFTGAGLRIDARRRTWEFSNGVWGTYIHEE